MKKLIAIVLLLAFLLCGCLPVDHVGKLNGVWEGDGSLEHAPLMGAEVLYFHDGKLIVEGGMGAGEYGVKATDDTLTIFSDWEEGAFGFSYKIKGDILILCGDVEFYRVG